MGVFSEEPECRGGREEPACRGGMLPDDSTGQGPVTRASGARKLSRRAPRERSEQRGCKEGMARVFAIRVQILLSITRVAIQV